MKNSAILALVLAGTIFHPGASRGVRTASWDVTGREATLKGTPSALTVGPLGTLELSPALDAVGEVDEYYAWCIVSDGAGGLYVGTGSDGKIYRIDKKGKSKLFFDTLELDILSLAVDTKGNLYAGTSPDGLVFRIGENGEGKTFFDSPEHYVWSLAFDDSGALYAGTGEQGKIYKIAPSGDAELFYDSPETNVLTLLDDAPRRRLLAGGDGRGLVMSVDREGKPSVLLDAPRTEISALFVDEAGRVFAAASGDEEPKKGNGDGGNRKNALLYRIETDGTTVLLWRSDAEFIYAVAPEADGALLVGTGSPGAIVRVTADGEPTELKRTTESQVLGLERVDGAVYASTGNQGRVYRVGPGRSEAGTYESDVLDALNLCRWGRIRWWGAAPKGTNVVFTTRSGNTEDPDDTWSEWKGIGDGDAGGPIASPPARYLQWRTELKGKDEASPIVERVNVSYKESNLPPAVLEVGVTRVGDTYYDGPADPRPEPQFQVLPNGTRVEFMPLNPKDPVPGAAQEVWAKGARVIRWQAADPNGDELLCDVHYLAAGDEDWKLLAEDVRYDYYAWETGSMPDGSYRVRVTAKDAAENSDATALTGFRVSDPFIIDNTAPQVTGLEARLDGDRVRVRGEAQDTASPILDASAAINAGDWRPVDPSDRIFDDLVESFDFTLSAGESKERVLLLRVTDQAGNAAVGRAVVR